MLYNPLTAPKDLQSIPIRFQLIGLEAYSTAALHSTVMRCCLAQRLRHSRPKTGQVFILFGGIMVEYEFIQRP